MAKYSARGWVTTTAEWSTVGDPSRWERFTRSGDKEKRRCKTLPRYFRTRPWDARTPRLCSSCRWSTTAGGWTPRWRGPPGASAGSQPGWRSGRPCDRTRLLSPRRSAMLIVETETEMSSLLKICSESQRGNIGVFKLTPFVVQEGDPQLHSSFKVPFFCCPAARQAC